MLTTLMNDSWVTFLDGYPQGSYHNSKPVKSGKPSHWGGSRILPGFSHLEGGKWFLLGGLSKSTR